MSQLTASSIAAATGGTIIAGEPNQRFLSVTTDSRVTAPGALFIPITGPSFDGHDFIKAAAEAGAFGALTSRESPPEGIEPGFALIKVNDTVKALGDIAAAYRRMMGIRVVAVTGSVGKTSTKDMIACALSGSLRTVKTEANQNNEIGLPATLLKVTENDDIAVVEMGMRGLGEIAWLSRIAGPDIAVVTNIGMAHIERLGSRENILRAKMEITEGLKPDAGALVLNGDDALLKGFKGLLPYKTCLYGLDPENDFRAENIITHGESGTEFDIRISNSTHHLKIPYPGMHNVLNALAALAVASLAGVPPESAISGIATWKPEKMRLNILNCGGIKIIDDVYNANPHSMAAALDVLSEVSGGSRSVAVLGDMLEIGDWSESAHTEIGEAAASLGITFLTAVGRYGPNIACGATAAGFPDQRVRTFAGNAEATEYLYDLLKPGDTVLVKGSRGMKMEEIVRALEKRFGKPEE